MRLIQWRFVSQARCTYACAAHREGDPAELLCRGEQEKKSREKAARLQRCSHPRILHPGIRGTLPMGNHDDRAA